MVAVCVCVCQSVFGVWMYGGFSGRWFTLEVMHTARNSIMKWVSGMIQVAVNPWKFDGVGGAAIKKKLKQNQWFLFLELIIAETSSIACRLADLSTWAAQTWAEAPSVGEL